MSSKNLPIKSSKNLPLRRPSEFQRGNTVSSGSLLKVSRRDSKKETIPGKKKSSSRLVTEQIDYNDQENTGKTKSVYDKYKEKYSSLMNENKDLVSKSTDQDEEGTNKGGQKLTSMPVYEKRNAKMNKDTFAKMERSAVVMRRMEYTNKIRAGARKKKAPKYKIDKVKKIQFWFRKYYIFKFKPAVKKIIRITRGFLSRNKVRKMKKYLEALVEHITKRIFRKFFSKIQKAKKPKPQEPPKAPVEPPPKPSPPVVEVPQLKITADAEAEANIQPETSESSIQVEIEKPIRKTETIESSTQNEVTMEEIGIQKVVEQKEHEAQIAPQTEETGCQIEIQEEPKMENLFGGKKGAFLLSGIKTFPRPRIEMLNTENILKRQIKKKVREASILEFKIHKADTGTFEPEKEKKSKKETKIVVDNREEFEEVPDPIIKILPLVQKTAVINERIYITKKVKRSKIFQICRIQKGYRSYLKHIKQIKQKEFTKKLCLSFIVKGIVKMSQKETFEKLHEFYIVALESSTVDIGVSDELDGEDCQRIQKINTYSEKYFLGSLS